MFATGFFANALCHIDALTFKSKKLLSQKSGLEIQWQMVNIPIYN